NLLHLVQRIGAQTLGGEQVQDMNLNDFFFVLNLLFLRFDADDLALDFFEGGNLGLDAAHAIEQVCQARVVGEVNGEGLKSAFDGIAGGEHDRGDFAAAEILQDE